VIVDPRTLDRRAANALVTGLVAPRPIAWVSTVAEDGRRNLAPFSFFNAFSFRPPTVGVAPGSRRGVAKDSLRNVRASGELVVNLVDERLAELANLSSAEVGEEVDEWELTGLEPAPSEVVRPDRVAASPAALECRVFEILELGEADEPTNSLIVARIERVHLRDGLLVDGQIDPDAAGLVGRMGADWWSRTADRFELPRPATADPAEIGAAAASARERLEG
jgi:flavin reductase (DIM6/NTAB) family NADH-FMN oxidoreductase RutF